MARTYGCYVYGIDLSVNMILTALERAAAAGNGDKVGSCCEVGWQGTWLRQHWSARQQLATARWGAETQVQISAKFERHDPGSCASGSCQYVRQRVCGAYVPGTCGNCSLQASRHSNRCAAQVSSQAQRRRQELSQPLACVPNSSPSAAPSHLAGVV